MKEESKFKQTEMGIIPEDWEVKILYDLIDIIGGGTPKTSKSEYWNGDIPWISIVDLKNSPRWISLTEKTITRKGLEESATNILKKGDLIISARGTVGELSQLKTDMAFNQSCYGLNAKRDINNDFLYYLLKSKIKELMSITHGSVFETITQNTFKQILIQVPPISEQILIAKILSDLDQKIELNQQINKNLEAIGRVLFKHWFIDFEFPNQRRKPYKSNGGEMVYSEELQGEIPKGWRVSKIGEKFKTVLGGTPSTTIKSYWENGTVAWINSGKINEFRITEPTTYITEEALNNSATKLLPKRTTVIAITGATLGQVSRIEIDTCANQSVIGVIESNTIPSEYIYFWIKHTINEIISQQTGGAQQHINKNNVDTSKILIPSEITMEEYKKIIEPIFDKISLSCFEIKNLSQIRDSLLPKLMSGQIRVPIPEKETAT